MINKVTNYVDYLTHQESFGKKEVLSRVVSAGLLALTPLEALYRLVGTALSFTAYVIAELFYLPYNLLELGAGTIDGSQFCEKQWSFLKNWILKPLAKTAITTVCIVLSPGIGVFSPKGMVAMHYDIGLAVQDPRNILPPPNQPSQPAPVVREEKPDTFVPNAELFEIFDHYLDYLKKPSAQEPSPNEWGVQMPAGIILHGPPGCGKTEAAKHFPRYAETRGITLNFMQIKGSDIATKWKGEGSRNIRKAFDDAKKIAPCVLFIDECEGLLPSREKLGDSLAEERTQELDEALQQIEDAKNHNVIVIGATNHIRTIDAAILRAGRFDFIHEIKPPDDRIRLAMLQKKLTRAQRHLNDDLDLITIAEKTVGFTASDIEALVRHACSEAFKARGNVTQELLVSSVEFVSKNKQSVAGAGKKEGGDQMKTVRDFVGLAREFISNLDRQQVSAAADVATV